MRKTIICITIFSLMFTTYASNLKITNTELNIRRDAEGNDLIKYSLTISLDNAWSNDKNNDAVWLFFKCSNANRQGHAKVFREGHQFFHTPATKGPDPEFQIPEDRMGIFVYPSEGYRGNIVWHLNISLDPTINQELQRISSGEVFGIEMVYIPKGAFSLGDPDSKALDYGALFLSDENGESKGLFSIHSEEEINVGAKNDALYYYSRNPNYQGDQKGPVPAGFPKGFSAFYIMKYELTQGQYVEFLNSISTEQTQHRANFGGRDYYDNRGGIYLQDGRYRTKYPDRPLNYASWDDGMAYADWAGLRPMTEFEFTKASRGPSKPIANEFCWGSGSKDLVQRFVNEKGDLVLAEGLDEAMLTDINKEIFAASYYWVMDLAGSTWERLVTIGHEDGRKFEGSHGDGLLTEYGFATNEDWPKGVAGGGGIGFRGGGFYEFGRNYHEFNPHSPIAYRRFGAWHGWNRTISYGQRFVRSSQ